MYELNVNTAPENTDARQEILQTEHERAEKLVCIGFCYVLMFLLAVESYSSVTSQIISEISAMIHKLGATVFSTLV